MKARIILTCLAAAVTGYCQPTIIGTVPYVPPVLPPGVIIIDPLLPRGPKDYAASGRFLNFSCRGQIGSSNPSIAGGMYISEGGRVLLVRAVGPSLTSFGVAEVLARPQLEAFDSAGRSVAKAVPWSATSPSDQGQLRTAAIEVGAFALREGSDDQVLLLFLTPGAYSFVVTGEDGSSGAILLEAYEVPSRRQAIATVPFSVATPNPRP